MTIEKIKEIFSRDSDSHFTLDVKKYRKEGEHGFKAIFYDISEKEFDNLEPFFEEITSRGFELYSVHNSYDRTVTFYKRKK